MDELRGPNIQIVLHVKEGLGFGFLRGPFIVSGSLNGYMLETDPVVPCHAPIFDAELVWEADKRKFRSLRVQNVPVKIEVFTTCTQGRKDKIGYLLLSLLGAQPNPSNKVVDIKHSWHRLLGVRSEGKCCHPQLMLSLTIEDRVNAYTPRNELRMFHSNEVAYPSTFLSNSAPPDKTSLLLTYNEYIAESKRSVSALDLKPQLICDEGLIQIGQGQQLFVLSFVIGSVENLDLLLPENVSHKDGLDCYVSYSIFTHNITTDRVGISESGTGARAQFHQRTALRVRSQLSALSRYFTRCPLLVAKVCAGDEDVGVCSMDLRKLIPTDNLKTFLREFCNKDQAICIEERCYIVQKERIIQDGRRPYVDVEMTLKYHTEKTQKPASTLTARSASQLQSGTKKEDSAVKESILVDCRSGSYSNLGDVDAAYTNMAASNTARYKNASGDSVLNSNEIADMIKKLCDSFTESQQKLLASNIRPVTSDMMVQCEDVEIQEGSDCLTARNVCDKEPVRLETSRSDTCIHNQNFNPQREQAATMETRPIDPVQMSIPALDRDTIMKRFVEELEDWKEKQQELFKIQLKRKEDYHLELLSKEWTKKRIELESKLSKGIEQCRTLAGDLSRATEDFRLRGYRNTEREKKLLDAKKALESHYTAKYQELRDASQKMEDDMNHCIKLKDMRIEELEMKQAQLEKQIDVLKNNVKNVEKEAEGRYSGLTKDQTASLIQELRCLEEKLDSAVQSKAFFKEQWGRAVRELHLVKLNTRKQMLSQLHHDRRQLGDLGLESISDKGESVVNDKMDIKKLKDDFYVDLLAHTPALESHSIINNSCPDGMQMYEELKCAPKNPLNEKLNDLIVQRDNLIQQESPNEELIKQLNHEIRSMLLNCGT